MTQDQGQTGFQVLLNAALNKSTAFTQEERDRLKLRGLLPAAIGSQATQIERILENLRRKESDIERYIALLALQGRNERLFYRTLIDNIDEFMPIVYTPTVGQACREFAHIFRQPRGFYITPQDRGSIRSILDNWPTDDVRVIVVTDGQRILGLGDLGANGMGIPIGKLNLYVACAGIQPNQCLPVMLDVGTNNKELRDDTLYLGVRSKRLEGAPYDDLVEEFVVAVQDKFPRALIQFEDFLTPNAYRLLGTYRNRVLCFNDDIQGTAAVALAGVYASTRISGVDFKDLTIMFLGAGSAATGIADLMVEAFKDQGLSEQEAQRRLWFVDINGLVVKSRGDLLEHNLPYAHDHKPVAFEQAIKEIKPHVLIGATGAPGTFTKEIVSTMAQINKRPVIFALSNPTSRAECTAQQAYKWSDGRVIFSSGSPFPPVTLKGKTYTPGQGNNAYIFPGIGLGTVISEATHICDDMFLAAAKKLAEQVTEEDLKKGAVYPPLNAIRNASLEIAKAVAQIAYDQDLANAPEPNNLEQAIAEYMYDPYY